MLQVGLVGPDLWHSLQLTAVEGSRLFSRPGPSGASLGEFGDHCHDIRWQAHVVVSLYVQALQLCFRRVSQLRLLLSRRNLIKTPVQVLLLPIAESVLLTRKLRPLRHDLAARPVLRRRHLRPYHRIRGHLARPEVNLRIVLHLVTRLRRHEELAIGRPILLLSLLRDSGGVILTRWRRGDRRALQVLSKGTTEPFLLL